MNNFVKYNDLDSFCEAYRLAINLCMEMMAKPVYTSFSIPKKSGGRRLIESPEPDLKLVQSAIVSYLNTLYRASEQVHGFVKKNQYQPIRNNLTNAQMHLKRPFLLNIDIKDFFHAISTKKVVAALQLEPFGLPYEFAAQLALLCTYEGHLPMGAPSSPLLSNIVCRHLDFRMQQLMGNYLNDTIVYTRYADDLSFSSLDAFPVFFDQLVLDVLSKEGFEVNLKKYRMAGPNQAKYVTGVKINKHLNLDRRYYRLLRAILHDAETNGLTHAMQNYARKNAHKTIVNEKQFVRMLYGKIRYMERVKGAEDPITYATFLRLKRVYQQFNSNHNSTSI